MKITVKPKFQSPFAWTILLIYFVGVFAAHAEMTSSKRPPSSREQFRIAQANPSAPANNPTPPAPAPIVVMPFDDALISAATALLSQVAGSDSASRIIVVDPLIDGMSGFQSNATRTMESMITELIRYKYKQLSVQKFTAAAVSKSPTVLVGTFTSVNKQGQTTGTREAYRICLVLADLKSGKVIAKGTARSAMAGVDVTPTPYYRDSPGWSKEAATDGYIATCQSSKPGEAINAVYVDSILVNSLLSEAIAAYDNGRYADALEFYSSAAQLPAGDTLRVYNGLYLVNAKLGRVDAANASFRKIIAYGLANRRIAVKFLFKPGSTIFWPDRQISGSYPMWLREISHRAAEANACLEITGHTSPTGPEPINERLSQLRADYIKQRLEADSPSISPRIIATGMGSRENFVGTGKDDMSDAIDRRVSFSVIPCQ
jgi:OmpA family protein